MPTFRKKPVEIEAVKFIDISSTGAASFSDMPEWLDQGIIRGDVFIAMGPQGPELNIATLEGNHLAAPGDMIIRGVKGELYPCKPDIFALTYDPVDATPPPASPPASPEANATTSVDGDGAGEGRGDQP